MRSIDSEKAVLGSMLISQEAAELSAAELRPEDFTLAAHQRVFTAMTALLNQGSAVDTVTVLSALGQAGELEKIGGAPFVTELFLFVPSAANVRHYLATVQDASRRRRFVSAMAEAIQEAERGEGAYIPKAQSAIDAALSAGGGIEPVGQRALEAVSRIGLKGAGHASGFWDFDYMLGGGLQNTDLIVIGARPGVGKTAFALNIAVPAALRGEVVLVVSLEMSEEQLLQRAAYSLCGLDKYQVMGGTGVEDMVAAADRIGKARLYIDDRGGLTAEQVKALGYRVKQKERRLDLVVVDYLQLVAPSGRKGNNRTEDVSEASRTMKQAAKALGCPIILLSQLSRALEARSDKRPILADLRESGSIEQDADVVGFLHRPSMYDPNADPNGAELIIAKNRSGATGSISLEWDGRYTRYRNRAWPEEPR